VRVDSFGGAVNAQFALTITSDDESAMCRTLRVQRILAGVPVA
jgi:hypothetical protein